MTAWNAPQCNLNNAMFDKKTLIANFSLNLIDDTSAAAISVQIRLNDAFNEDPV